MAEEEAVVVTPEAPLDHQHKRKLEDSTLELDGDRKNDDKGANGDEEPAKRPRLDEIPDALASQNGHKPEEDNGHAVDNAEAEAVSVENTETVVNNQVAGDEGAKDTLVEESEAQPNSESDQKINAQGDDSGGQDVQVSVSENVQLEGVEKVYREAIREPVTERPELGDASSGQHHPDSGTESLSRKIEIPNNKVGVLIGKSGDTIRYLQINSGARIQITRDAEADPRSATRPVELVGTLESLNKAEKLIKDVIAEADAGGSPSLVARGFTAAMTSGSVELEIPIPGDKVGLVIGRGGETIRSLQTRSGARIQLIPQNLPGDQSKEKKVKVYGDRKQVDMARELIKEVMNQLPGKPSQFSSNNYNQQGYRPRVPGGASQWGTRGPPQPTPYDYHQRGPYPPQNQQYPPQSYSNFPLQGPPRSGFNSGWEQRPPSQGPPPHSGGYDYYGQGGGHAANAPVSAAHSTHPGHPSGAPPHSQANYNYAQPRGADYAHPAPYSQSAPHAQSYGPGYGEPKYDTQGPVQQQPYGGQAYPSQQQGYPSQQYNRPPPPYQAPSQGYAPPSAANQPPADAPYQAPVSAAQPYSQNVQQHQQYPYASAAATQAVPHGSAPVTNDGYTQPQPAAAGYPQQVPAYGQQAAGYAQTAAPAGGYGQYPTSVQPGYGDQSTVAAATGAATYGYQSQVDPSAYAAAAAGQQGYAQPQPGYDHSAAAPQSGGYASVPAGAPVPQPQPGYPQYDASQQVYSAPR